MARIAHSMLEEYKTQAALLLKQLHSETQEIAEESAKRFQILPRLNELDLSEILASQEIKLKHALLVIAHEHGYETWTDFKQTIERKEAMQSQRGSMFSILYPPHCSGFINEWHSSYEVASLELGKFGGYLFPYKSQYFICQSAYIDALGLDPNDPDWERIGWNWVVPQDQAAWQRLKAKLEAVSAEKLGNSNDAK